MSSIKITRTIRAYVGQPRFQKMLDSVVAQFPEYKQIEDGKSYKNFPETMNCPKLMIKACVENKVTGKPMFKIVKRYYKPNK